MCISSVVLQFITAHAIDEIDSYRCHVFDNATKRV